MSQTIQITFAQGQTEAIADQPLEQWAYGQTLVFNGLDLPTTYQVDFSNWEFEGDSVPRIGNSDGVSVPVEVLTSGLDVFAFIWIQDQDSGSRKYKAQIRVIPGPLPDPEEPNPEESSTIAELIAELNDAVTDAETAVSHYPKIVNDYWQVWDVDAEEYVDTGVKAAGDPGPDSVTVNQTTGDDSTGNPYRTIAAAVASGAKRISLAADYYGSFSINKPCVIDGNGFTVYGDVALTVESYGDILRAAYEADTLITQCFVSHTKDLTTTVTGSSWKGPKFNICVYADDQKLTPVADVATCEATENSFTWDEGYFYFRAAGSRFGYVTEDSCSISADVTVHDLNIRHYMSHALQISDGSVEIIGSRAIGSVNQNCIYANSCAVILRNVEVAYSWNDGVNVHTTGNCVLIDCYAHDCSDDGVSHHDHTTGTVIGGEFCRCGKGGISSPVNASKVDIYGAYCHDNDYGVYATASSSEPQTYNVIGCVLTGNRVGLMNGKHTVRLYGNRIFGNTTNKSNQSGGTMTELDQDVIPAPVSAQAGQFLVYDGSKWTAQTVPSANGEAF